MKNNTPIVNESYDDDHEDGAGDRMLVVMNVTQKYYKKKLNKN